MPSQPSWFQRVSAILSSLERLEAPYLDRKSVERLFGVRERRARQIMAGLPGIEVGNAAAVDRIALIGRLRDLAAGDRYAQEMGRREKVWAVVQKASREAAARNVVIGADKGPETTARLPEGISIGNGTLRVDFEDAEDLAGRLYALSQWMAADWDAFCRLTGDPGASLPSRNAL